LPVVCFAPARHSVKIHLLRYTVGSRNLNL